ncbi:MAG: diaminopimelate epimerase [Candidatus Omnitrophica bacterium]|nr:diaminopimelate epimerase [Candidatus Omnitrophota bacterium]
MNRIRFTKAVATGNDFIIVDNRSASILKSKLAALAKRVCERKWSIGADGMLVIERSEAADFKMRIFNPDGSEAEMCGNGSRCIALYAKNNRIAGKAMTIATLAGVLNATVKGDTVKVKLPDPRDIKWNLCLIIHKCPYKVNFVNTGVPHVVYFVDDLNKVDVRDLGSHMRGHKEFSPEGANADFVKVINKHHIKVRTYERGVEDETLACGTGAVASAVISAESEKLESPITVQTRGGEKLKVYFELVEGYFRNVYLEGAAKLVYEGVMKDV